MAANKKLTKAQVTTQLKKSVAAFNRKVVQDNKKFEAMTPSQKRGQIAQDVLDQLRTKRLVAKNGVWLDTEDFLTADVVKKDVELQDLLKKQKSCDACAIGGMFMCAVERADKLKTSELLCGMTSETLPAEYVEEESNEVPKPGVHMFDAFSYLEKFFSMAQLRLVELAFENGSGGVERDSESYNEDDEAAASTFFEYTHDDEDCLDLVLNDSNLRMQLIMQNIIAHKGRFNPYKKPVRQVTWSTPGYEVV